MVVPMWYSNDVFAASTCGIQLGLKTSQISLVFFLFMNIVLFLVILFKTYLVILWSYEECGRFHAHLVGPINSTAQPNIRNLVSELKVEPQ